MVNFPTVQRSDDGYYVWCIIMIPKCRHQHRPRQEQLDTWVHLITPGHRQQTADSGLAGEQFLCTISRVLSCDDRAQWGILMLAIVLIFLTLQSVSLIANNFLS